LVQLTLDHFIDRREKELVSDSESCQTTTDVGRMGTYSKVGVANDSKRKSRK
jgi:hypothetical protein